jgi:alkylhydroperoxidase/carboxymuconolactone decarboxylase family protein YurZ
MSDHTEGEIDDAVLMKYMWGDEESVKRFLARRRSPLSDAHAELMASANEQLWSRRVLPLKTMALVNLGILAALNRPIELHTRLRGLLRAGVRPEELREVLLQVAFYCGNPAGVEALTMLVDAVDESRELGYLVHEPEIPDGWSPRA